MTMEETINDTLRIALLGLPLAFRREGSKYRCNQLEVKTIVPIELSTVELDGSEYWRCVCPKIDAVYAPNIFDALVTVLQKLKDNGAQLSVTE